MRLIFVSQDWKFHVDTKKTREMLQKAYGFLDSLICIGNGKSSLLLREYL